MFSQIMVTVTGHFSVKKDLTQFRKYRSLEHLLFFRMRNELQCVKAQKGSLQNFLHLLSLKLFKYYWLRVLYDKRSSVKSLGFCRNSQDLQCIKAMFLEEGLVHLI